MSSPAVSRSRSWLSALLVVPVLAGLSGCGPSDAQAASKPVESSSAGRSSGSSSPSSTPAGPAVTTNAANDLPARSALTVSTTAGRLTSVRVSGPYGNLEGSLNADGTRWTSSGERAPKVAYHLSATATNTAGGTTELDRTFTTGASPHTLTADVDPYGGQTFGVGQPIVVTLSAPVNGKAARAAVEKALVVSADKQFGPGSWYWWSGTQLHYRPKEFWPAHTKVHVDVNLEGVHAGEGLWGGTNRAVDFNIGRSFVMQITNSSHQMTVTVDGQQVRTVPVSMGRSGFETRSGIKTVMSHEQSVRMTSASYGGKDFYDETVYLAQRLTWSGEYIHSAPWSVGSQGHANVSHGCVNVSPGNAQWLFDQTLVGDPVITTGTGRQMEPGNGTGGDWDISWAAWVAGSALS
ncbi:MAG TPA: Ig-like domain-containing protein [Kineosporiaceae bacterium]|nr:Ig-like domain-containing protein [Kineosporiaceae bacterium]